MTEIGTDQPELILLQTESLVSVRRRLFAGDPRLMAADERLIQEAHQALEMPPCSVLDKPQPGPSGEMRDYASIDPMWWPDESAKDGLPYMSRNDEVNPEFREWDRMRLNAVCSAVNTLSLGYFFSDVEEFASHAALLTRTWFLDHSTAMRPSLAYAGRVPGRWDGDHRGISEGIPLLWVMDAVGLLAESRSWTTADGGELRQWYQTYLDWLRVSDQGRRQSLERGHHGTWYDVQVAAIALFVGDDTLCRQISEEIAPKRVGGQIDGSGRQAHEETRGQSLDSAATNLAGLFDLAELAARVGVDLWGFESPDGASIKGGFQRLLDRAIDEQDPRAGGIDPFQLLPLARRAAIQYRDPTVEQRLQAIVAEDLSADRTNLLYPTANANQLP